MVKTMNEATQRKLKIVPITPDKGDPDYYIAKYLALIMGGKITKHVDDDEYPDDVVI